MDFAKMESRNIPVIPLKNNSRETSSENVRTGCEMLIGLCKFED